MNSQVVFDESIFETDSAKENRKVKDSVFVDLFYSDETAIENLISLYNALHPEQKLTPGTKVQKFRLEQVLYMNFQNDITANFRDRLLIFGEPQSKIQRKHAFAFIDVRQKNLRKNYSCEDEI